MHKKASDFFQSLYIFIKPHEYLKFRIGSWIRKWVQRTPAMAEGITDYRWVLKKLSEFRVPVQ
jgi:hypothetical protein